MYNVLIMWCALMIVLLLCVFGYAVYSLMEEELTDYKMPNGIVCEDKIGRSTLKFSECTDGKTYINPETYREVRK